MCVSDLIKTEPTIRIRIARRARRKLTNSQLFSPRAIARHLFRERENPDRSPLCVHDRRRRRRAPRFMKSDNELDELLCKGSWFFFCNTIKRPNKTAAIGDRDRDDEQWLPQHRILRPRRCRLGADTSAATRPVSRRFCPTAVTASCSGSVAIRARSPIRDHSFAALTI